MERAGKQRILIESDLFTKIVSSTNVFNVIKGGIYMPFLARACLYLIQYRKELYLY